MTSYKELQDQIARLQAEAEQVRKNEIANVITDIRSKMAEFGITLKDLGSEPKGKGRRKGAASASPAKFRNPDTGETWTGKGRRPKWIVEAENQGKSANAFLIA
jgi:DNA-binding protein H-NS